MKKFYIMLAAVAAMALSASAQTQYLQIGDFDGSDEGYGCYDGGAKEESPINFYHYHSASQIIYTAEDLADMTGANKEFKINEISFKYFNGNCFGELSRKITVYMQEVDNTTFNVDLDGYRQFFDIDVDAPVAELDFYGDMVEVYYMSDVMTITLDEPFTYTGKTLVVTVVADGEDCTDCGHDVAFYANDAAGAYGKAMTYALDAASFYDYLSDPYYPRAAETYGTAPRVAQPVTQFGYTVTEVSSAMPGDANGDGNVDPADISALINYLLNGSPVNEANADCNQDGSIDPADISAIINMLLNGAA